ncbi:hypothetical protein ILUMI_02288 [Ignelater luminosus]|uniref:Uncharacterized protein n=1 Tax=Ignelater luminosus TaxID=2038154 RepID=A0A8K0GLH4_IGNLU|nr:hypothetical protein ILUMI_02288 [Ignelater luminosus]
MAGVDKVVIEKLSGVYNWGKWKISISLLLKKHNLIDIVNGDRDKPVLPTAGASDATYLTDLKKWKSDDAETMLHIMTTLDERHQFCSKQRLDRLLKEFFRWDRAATEDTATHGAKLQKHFSELNSALKK